MLICACLLRVAFTASECTIYFRDHEETREITQIKAELEEHLGAEQVLFGAVKDKGVGLRMVVTLPDLNHKQNTRKQQ